MNGTHGAYSLLRLARQGRLPDTRTRLGKAVKGIERAIWQHFGQLNNMQQLELFHLLPLWVFILQHDMLIKDGRLAEDWKWAWSKIENGLKVLCDLGNSKPGPKKALTIAQIIHEAKQEKTGA